MTTIAYKDGVLAADSLATYGNRTFMENKITYLSDGTAVAVAGEGVAAHKFVEFLLNGTPPDTTEDQEFEALRITPDGVMVYTGQYLNAGFTTDPVAIGSGGSFAVAGMHLGMSAAEAVKLATEIDPASGGDICVAVYKEPEDVAEESLWQKIKTYLTTRF